ncbi:cytochrome c(L), periplasmic [Azospirillum halopraeferens]|uniref:cytochrome c(L), periplasmic n=1 Tax=Azospirillum halopraeferens TaxID=34010 RepID=UPI00040A9A1F|nr:cytochrome c(L), periplasmic [Azospirillum halopraeferens]
MFRLTTVTIILGAALGIWGLRGAQATLSFNHTVTGEVLDLEYAPPEGRDTEAVKRFLDTGRNLYNEDPVCLPDGADLYLSACSGCHGHVGEGKIGPGLNDDYWTYPKNASDKGLFETIYGGAQGQMGPQYMALTLDEMLLVMAWVRHLYTGPADTADWLTEEQRRAYKPYSAKVADAAHAAPADGACRAAAKP